MYPVLSLVEEEGWRIFLVQTEWWVDVLTLLPSSTPSERDHTKRVLGRLNVCTPNGILRWRETDTQAVNKGRPRNLLRKSGIYLSDARSEKSKWAQCVIELPDQKESLCGQLQTQLPPLADIVSHTPDVNNGFSVKIFRKMRSYIDRILRRIILADNADSDYWDWRDTCSETNWG